MAGMLGMGSAEWDRMAEGERVELIMRKCAEQHREWQAIDAMIGSKEKDINYIAKWLRRNGQIWDAIADAYGQGRFAALADRLDMGGQLGDTTAVFLTALSTIDTYEEAWRAAIEHSTGYTHETLVKARSIEDDINSTVCEAVSRSIILFRGTNIIDAQGMRWGWGVPNPNYTFVSMGASSHHAIRIAKFRESSRAEPHVLMLVDALRARELGAEAAQYSMAAEVQRRGRVDESVRRMFRLEFASEMQAHFDVGWPPAASDALLAISPIKKPSDYLLGQIRRLGVPVISLDDV